MASTSEEERLKAEIAKLSGAIQTHKQQQQHQPYAGGYASRGRGHYAAAASPPYRGGYAGGRGGFHSGANGGRGRGRGAAAGPLRNRTLILNDSSGKGAMGSSSTDKNSTVDTGGASSGSATSTTPGNGASSAAASTTDGWIKRKSTHNMSLVSTSTFQRTEPARLAAMEATRKAKAEAKAAAAASSSTPTKRPTRGKPAKPSSSVRRGDNMGEVVIDGVVFEFDPSGTKLVKKPVQPSTSDNAPKASTSTTGATSSTAVPLKTSINGQEYIRTKRGNLISASLLAKRKAQREAQAKMGRLDRMVGQISAMQATRNASARGNKAGSRTLDVKKARTLCTFFNKTGQCKRGLSCPYVHDSSKIALCPKVLRPAGCTLPRGTCPLSHTPRAERVPHCVHYLRSGQCRNGDECLYTHSDKLLAGVATKICREFSDYGWCERGGECTERHTYECPDFVEKGKCERKACKLVHVIRASQPNDAAASDQLAAAHDAESEGEAMQDGDLFMRDDAAAAEESQDEGARKAKRKRPLMQTDLDDDQLLPPDEDDDDDDEQVNFANAHDSRKAKRRKAKAFTQQRDFISFDDEDVDDEEEDEESEVGAEVSDDDEDEHEEVLEAGSVHSEDFELSDGGVVEEEEEDDDEEAEDEEEEEAEDAARSAKTTAHHAEDDDDDDDDDDLVDRDL